MGIAIKEAIKVAEREICKGFLLLFQLTSGLSVTIKYIACSICPNNFAHIIT